MRWTEARLSTRQIIALIAILALPLAFWTWRFRAHFPFPTRFDLMPLGVSIVAVAQLASLRFGRSRPRLARSVVGGLWVLNFVVLVWFTSVEWRWIQEDCLRCYHVRWVAETRFFGSERREITREMVRPVEWVSIELGIRCDHSNISRWLIQRWLGGVLPVEINNFGMISTEAWYSPCKKATIQAWVAEDPNLAATFRAKILDRLDLAYLKTFFTRLHAACPNE
jgi:hypothetical protein